MASRACLRPRARVEPLPPYGSRGRCGPYWRQAARLAGRTLQAAGTRLEDWSWQWRP